MQKQASLGATIVWGEYGEAWILDIHCEWHNCEIELLGGSFIIPSKIQSSVTPKLDFGIGFFKGCKHR